MQYKEHPQEKLYFIIMSIVSLSIYAAALMLSRGFVLGYIPFITLYTFLGARLFAGRIKGNAIQVNEAQFSQVYALLKQHAQALNIDTPEMYIMHGHGLLNAFATRLAKRNYVVVYADVLEVAYEEGMDAVSFIIGHELGHLKRKHISFFKAVLTLPAYLVPILGSAYSRACEYTCDRIGYALAPNGAASGMLILATGKRLYKKINRQELLMRSKALSGFDIWLSEIFSSHPHLLKRFAMFESLDQENLAEEPSFVSPKVHVEKEKEHTI